jgi:cell division protein FtsB
MEKNGHHMCKYTTWHLSGGIQTTQNVLVRIYSVYAKIYRLSLRNMKQDF